MIALTINTAVRLHADGFDGEVRSRVEDVRDDGRIVIANPSVDGVDFTLAVGREVGLEWSIKRGVARQDAVVVAHVDVGVPALLLQPLGAAVAHQRRGFVRVEALLPVAVVREDGEEHRGTTLDVSGGGLRAVISTQLEDGEGVKVAIGLPDQPPVRCHACTIRFVDKDTYAFEFDEIEPSERERLIRFVFSYQRELLRQGRLSA